MTYRTDLPPLIVAIQPEAHRVAMELAAAQSTPKKASASLSQYPGCFCGSQLS